MLAITNARIVPVTAAVIEKGTIVIRGGKIEALGANVQVPQGATVIDAKGGHVYPGFINARTTVGIGENGVRGYDDVSEMHDWNQQLRTRVGVSLRERHHPGGTRDRRDHGRRRAGRRDHVGRVRGHESRRLDVGRSDAARQLRHRLQLPGARPAAADEADVVAVAAAARQRRSAPMTTSGAIAIAASTK